MADDGSNRNPLCSFVLKLTNMKFAVNRLPAGVCSERSLSLTWLTMEPPLEEEGGGLGDMKAKRVNGSDIDSIGGPGRTK